MACSSVNTDMHSANTLRPESERPSCGRYPAVVPLATISAPKPNVSRPARTFTGGVAGVDQPVGVFKKKFVAEAVSGAGKLNHGLESSSHKERQMFHKQPLS